VPLLLTGLIVIAGAFCFGFLIKRVEPIRRT
jgi:MFS transporter, ACS family, D-galactonate transporter